MSNLGYLWSIPGGWKTARKQGLDYEEKQRVETPADDGRALHPIYHIRAGLPGRVTFKSKNKILDVSNLSIMRIGSQVTFYYR